MYACTHICREVERAKPGKFLPRNFCERRKEKKEGGENFHACTHICKVEHGTRGGHFRSMVSREVLHRRENDFLIQSRCLTSIMRELKKKKITYIILSMFEGLPVVKEDRSCKKSIANCKARSTRFFQLQPLSSNCLYSLQTFFTPFACLYNHATLKEQGFLSPVRSHVIITRFYRGKKIKCKKLANNSRAKVVC